MTRQDNDKTRQDKPRQDNDKTEIILKTEIKQGTDNDGKAQIMVSFLSIRHD
jgi:hypothetical protein